MGAPDFAAGIDQSQSNIPGAPGLQSSLDSAGKGAAGINYDWNGVNKILGQMGGEQQYFDDRANGGGVQAGDVARSQQQNLAASGSDAGSLGKALMQLGSKASTNQASQAAGAQQQQQMAMAQQATQLAHSQAAARLGIYKSQLQLEQQKFDMARAVQQSRDGLDLAQLNLKVLFNGMTAKARNAQELGNITLQHDQFNQIMTYLSTGLGAASAASAAGASAMGPSSGAPQTSADSGGGGSLNYQYGGGTTGDAPTYGGMVDSTAGHSIADNTDNNALFETRAFYGEK